MTLPLPVRNGVRPRLLLSVSEETRACAQEAQTVLQAAGYDTQAFPADGVGGRELEHSLALGQAAGVLELALNEIADGLLGGTRGAGAGRLEAAGRAGLPRVVVPGGLDVITFGPRASVPVRFGRRRFHEADPARTLMRTDVSDCARLGRLLAEKLNASTGPTAVCLPLRGISTLSENDGPLRWIEADMALFGNLTTHLRRDIALYDANVGINAPGFARLCAETLLGLLALNRNLA